MVVIMIILFFLLLLMAAFSSYRLIHLRKLSPEGAVKYIKEHSIQRKQEVSLEEYALKNQSYLVKYKFIGIVFLILFFTIGCFLIILAIAYTVRQGGNHLISNILFLMLSIEILLLSLFPYLYTSTYLNAFDRFLAEMQSQSE